MICCVLVRISSEIPLGGFYMDREKAVELFEKVRGTEIDGIVIDTYIDNGKSASVYSGKKGDKLYAVKIFDNEIVRRSEVELQQQRIELELSLQKYGIPNLVKILDGGKTAIDKIEYYYIVMEYVKGMNLRKYIENNKITTDFIVNVMNILIDTTEILLKNNPPFVHRDIKPENIMVSDKSEIILMDFGLIKIVGLPSMTDVENKQFLGTLRYAPPEFLLRQEEDKEEDWRAINIYQIGAVLHDLIMKKEIFAGTEPFSNVVISIINNMPSIANEDYRPELIQLARDMLQKDWRCRLRSVPIDRIKNVLNKCLLPQETQENYFDTIKTRALSFQEKLADFESMVRNKEEKKQIMDNTNKKIWNIIDSCFDSIEFEEILQTVRKSKIFTMDTYEDTMPMMNYRFYKITGKFEYGFDRYFLILFNVDNDENNLSKISLIGIIPDVSLETELSKPEELMKTFFRRKREELLLLSGINSLPPLDISLISIFEGIVELEDNSLKNVITKFISKLLDNITKIMEPDVNDTLEMKKQEMGFENKVGIFTKISYGNKIVGIEEK
jgi:serine/threonine protein kinase